MKCSNCDISIMDKPLRRTTEKGNSNPRWMCDDCMEIIFPEMLKKDQAQETRLEKEIKQQAYK